MESSVLATEVIYEWAVYITSLLIALRTFLGSVVRFLDWLDSRDNKKDWPWVQTLANALYAFDGLLEHLPVKSIGKGRQ